MNYKTRKQAITKTNMSPSSLRCNHFVTESQKCHNKVSVTDSRFCDAHRGIYVCPYTGENLKICKQKTRGATFCKQHDTFLKANTWNHNRKKYKIKVVYVKYEDSRDPERILKEMSGRIMYCIAEGIYPDHGHQIRLLKLLNLHLSGKK